MEPSEQPDDCVSWTLPLKTPAVETIDLLPTDDDNALATPTVKTIVTRDASDASTDENDEADWVDDDSALSLYEDLLNGDEAVIGPSGSFRRM